MKTKRILSLIISVVILAVAVLSFSSCKFFKKDCEHTFAEEWSTDATNHWHAATCEHTEEKDALGAHVDANNDRKCDVCAYSMPGQIGEVDSGLNANSAVTYTVTVVNAAGEPVKDVSVKLLDKENLVQGDGLVERPTGEDGKVTFNTLYKSGWLAQVVAAPEGYTYETNLDEETGVEFVATYEFDESFCVTVTLVTVEVDNGAGDEVTE